MEIIVFEWIRGIYEMVIAEIKNTIDEPIMLGFLLLLFKAVFWVVLLLAIVILILKWPIGIAVLILILLIQLFDWYGKRNK